MKRSAEQDRPIRVFVLGMNERMKNTLRFFFQGPCENYCVLAEEDSADLGIIDLDGYQGRQHMKAYRERHPGQPLILISLQDEEVEDAIHLRKPLKPKLLISALEQAQAKVQPPARTACETTPALQPDEEIQAKAESPAGSLRETTPLPDEATESETNEKVQVSAQPETIPSSEIVTEFQADETVKLRMQEPEQPRGAIEKVFEHLESAADSSTPPDRENKHSSLTAPTPKSGTHQAAIYLDEQKAHAYIGSAPDLDINDAQQLADAQYDPDEFFQGYLRNAINTADRSKRAVKLKMPRGAIIVMPDTHAVLVAISNSRLRTFCTVPVIDGTLTVSTKKINSTAERAKQIKTMSMESLLWKVAIWASRGRLPAGTSLTQPVFLRRWPNMTRLMLFPHAMRIAALWAEQPHSLLDTAEMLGIPQRYVFGFYSAANALGLAAVSHREVDSLVESPPVKKNMQRGLFGRILDRLRNNG